MKKIIYIIMSIFIIQIVGSYACAKDFSDVLSTNWAYEYINYLSDNGIINGYQDDTFRPSNNVSRAEFIKLITSASKGEDYFTYEKERTFNYNWYDVYMNYALNNGFFTKEVGYGVPNDFITRKEMIVILGKIAKTSHLIEYSELKEAPFNDVDNIFDDAEIEFVNYSYSSELIKGYEDGSFKPLNNMTRAEVATVIYNFVKKVNQE